MAIANNNFDGGSDGTTISTANSGGASGNAFDSITNTPVFSSTHVHSGTLALKSTGNQQRASWTSTIGAQADVYGRAYIYRTAAPTNTSRPAQPGGCIIQLNSTRKIQAFANAISAGPSANLFPLNQWFRVEWHFAISATGSLEVRLFLTDSEATTPTETLTGSGNTGTPTALYDFGEGSTAGTPGTNWIDDVNINTSGFPGPLVASLPEPLIVRQAVNQASTY